MYADKLVWPNPDNIVLKVNIIMVVIKAQSNWHQIFMPFLRKVFCLATKFQFLMSYRSLTLFDIGVGHDVFDYCAETL